MALGQLSKRVKDLIGIGESDAYPLKQSELFPQDLVVHFSYHKCLTYYYKRVMDALSKEFGLYYRSCASKSEMFNREAIHHPGKRLVTLSDSGDIEWEQLPLYKGSHFVRDPRDLIVSGYHYHLWTEEEWCRKPNFGWPYFTAMPEFEFVTTDPDKMPRDESYQQYLQTLEPESGMILELLWRKPHFEQMRRWDFQNPRILELRYEDVMGQERDAFERLFTHYGFHPRLLERGLELVETFSLKNQPRGKGNHSRSGESQQWEQEFTPLVQQVFDEKYGDLLTHLGYANGRV